MNTSMIVLDTSSRRSVWRNAFSNPPCVFIGEGDIPALSGQNVLFLHETDFGPSFSSAIFVQRRLPDVTKNFGGNKVRAQGICTSIDTFRCQLQQIVSGGTTVLLIYSGAPLDEATLRIRIKLNIAALPSERVLLLPQIIPQDIAPSSLARIANTCIYSIKSKRDMASDLAATRRCMECKDAINAMKDFQPHLLDGLQDDELRVQIQKFLEGRYERDPKMLLSLLPHLLKIL